MSRRFLRNSFLNEYDPQQNQLVNGGFDIWQRDVNWQRAFAAGQLVLASNVANSTGSSTFTVKIGSASGAAAGAYNLPSAGWVLIDNEIIRYTSYSPTSVITIPAGTTGNEGRGIAQFQPSEAPGAHTGALAANAATTLVRQVWGTAGDYTADKWRLDTSSGNPVGRFLAWMETAGLDVGSTYGLGFRWIGGSLPVTAGFYGTPWAALPISPARVYQNIEHYNGLFNKAVSFTGRIKCTVAGKVRLFITAVINQAGNTRYRVLGFSSYNTLVNTFQTLSVPNVVVPTTAVPDSGGAAGSVVGLQVGFEFAAGTILPATEFNIEGVLDNCMLTIGPPSEYIASDLTTDLLRAMRFYEKVYGGMAAVYAAANTYPGVFVPFRVLKSPAGTVFRRVRGIWTLVNTYNSASVFTPQVGDASAITGFQVYGQFASGGIEQMGVWLFTRTNTTGSTTFMPSSADDFVEVSVQETY